MAANRADRFIFLGRFRLGDRIELPVVCTDASGTAALPDQAPVVSIYKPGVVFLASHRMPVADRYNQPGLFALSFFLGSGSAIGQYTAMFQYKIGDTAFLKGGLFEVVGGGGIGGAVVSAYDYSRPQADLIVFLTEDGGRSVGRNPGVSG